MTAIVGLVDGDRVWLGADSLGVSGCLGTPRPPEIAKIGRVGEMLIGHSGDVRPAQIALHLLEIPEHPDGLGVVPYLVRHFVPALRGAFSAHGQPTDRPPDQGGPNWSLVLGYRGGLYVVECDFNVTTSARGYYASGCGREFALGSLHTTRPYGDRFYGAETRVRLALEAAAELDVYVAAPFVIESVS